MTTVFVETLKPFLTIAKVLGLLNVFCTLENGILRRDTSSTYYLFLEVIRMFVLLIITFYLIYMKPPFIITYLNIIKYWVIVVTARISEKWIIKYVLQLFFVR